MKRDCRVCEERKEFWNRLSSSLDRVFVIAGAGIFFVWSLASTVLYSMMFFLDSVEYTDEFSGLMMVGGILAVLITAYLYLSFGEKLFSRNDEEEGVS